MSLLRLAFWLSVVVYLLPSDPQQQARLRATVMSVMGRGSGLCNRGDRACMDGGEFWTTFVRKAEFGVRLVGDIIGGGHTMPYAQTRWDKYPTGRADPRGPTPPPDFDQPPWRARGGGW
jgi:hypothetical protein